MALVLGVGVRSHSGSSGGGSCLGGRCKGPTLEVVVVALVLG